MVTDVPKDREDSGPRIRLVFGYTCKTADSCLVAAELNGIQVMGGYRFLMENYTAGDHICLFGFSRYDFTDNILCAGLTPPYRGAYTARCLAGMLHKVGLLPKSNEEQISFAYKRYKDTSDTGKRRAKGFKAAFSRTVSINFIGVWCVHRR